ncbi:conserved exported hypothetical protein [Desulfamplus magnetovallimortis]|uniref:Uncharacterized protein n=1 Tax=Desulfamplus magnetovallimortis TaxID=1246637 RepID=A0A1W1HA87_9BACT|nr:hypothetical protein [Desulfamplus magnetovallimortis]SLM29315.1 conserved exported hypothetical protein [Desulfamplus magnetovallimortis]
MKKVVLCVLFSCFILGLALPAAALEVDFSGEFYVEGIYNSNENMLDTDASSDYRQMRLRVQTDFKISDNLSLSTRFDALEKVLSSNDSAFANGDDGNGWDSDIDDDNIDFDRAYLSYISPIGLFQVGRMQGITWGTTFCDDESDTDRIKYVLPIPMGEGKLYFGAVAEKVTENDMGTAVSDMDNDKYYIGLTYKTEKYSTGLLSAFYNFKRFQDPGQAFAVEDVTNSYKANGNDSDYRTYLADNDMGDSFTSYAAWYGTNAVAAGTAKAYADAAAAYAAAGDAASAAAAAAQAQTYAAAIDGDWANDVNASSLTAISSTSGRGPTNEGKVYLLAPYFQGTFGNLTIQAELDYVFGTTEYDVPGVEDRDVKSFGYFAEAGYDFGAFGIEAGFAHTKGDADYTDNDIESMGFVSPGVDWAKLFILNADDHGMNTTLGNGVGNHVGNGFATPSTAMCDGYQMFYAGFDFDVTENINLGVIGALSTADEVPEGEGYDDDQGMECDVTFTWNLTDNLQYKAIGAYLDGGDYWSTRASGGVVDPNVETEIYTLYHSLTVTF